MKLLLPIDGCPGCVTTQKQTRLVHPYQVVALDIGTGIRAWYECPDCGHSWWTSWQSEQLDVPCPGCPTCIPSAGVA